MHWREDKWPTLVFSGCPCGSAGKESTCSEGGLGSIPGLGRSPGEGKEYPLQYADLEISMDYIVHELQRVKNDWATFTFTFLNLGYLVFFNLQITTSITKTTPFPIQITCPLLLNFYATWIPPHLLREVLSGLLEMLSSRLKVLNIPTK